MKKNEVNNNEGDFIEFEEPLRDEFKNILVIGNGFDLSGGLYTSFKDFILFLVIYNYIHKLHKTATQSSLLKYLFKCCSDYLKKDDLRFLRKKIYYFIQLTINSFCSNFTNSLFNSNDNVDSEQFVKGFGELSQNKFFGIILKQILSERIVYFLNNKSSLFFCGVLHTVMKRPLSS